MGLLNYSAYEKIVEASGECILILDIHGRILNFNSNFNTLLNLKTEEISNRIFADLLHRDEGHLSACRQYFVSDGNEKNNYYCLKGTDNSKVWVKYSSCDLKNDSGQVIGTIKKLIEIKNTEENKITDLKSLSDLALASENYFRKMCEALPQIVWTSEPNGFLDFYNNHWFEYTGMNLEQTQGWGWEPVIHPEDLQNCRVRWTHSLKTGVDYEVEYRFKRAVDNQYRWFLGRALPLRNDAGKIIKWFGTCTDINEQKNRAETLEREVTERTEALKASNLALINSAKMTALGEMAGGIAHEINNPLGIIKGYANLLPVLLQRVPFEKEKITKYAETIESTVGRIAKIVEGLRDFSRESENLAPESRAVKSIVESTLNLCSEKFKLHQVDLVINYSSEDLMLVCRPIQISQVLINLLNNAFQAVEKLPTKWINLDIKKAGENILFVITDSGTPINKLIQSQLFQPFFTTKPNGLGTGLGLSISKSLIESHEGKLYFDAESSLTKFVMSIPINLKSEKLTKNAP